jgi:hypothetical protein
MSGVRRDNKGEGEVQSDTHSSPSYTSAPAREEQRPTYISALIDLNAWHHALHQVTGDMALCFNKAVPADLICWAKRLQAVASEMADKARGCDDGTIS